MLILFWISLWVTNLCAARALGDVTLFRKSDEEDYREIGLGNFLTSQRQLIQINSLFSSNLTISMFLPVA